MGDLATASKAVETDARALGLALRLYETAVAAVAQGSASILRAAALELRGPRRLGAFGAVTGQRASETMLSWDCARGATGYAVQVNVKPNDPAAWSKPVAGNRLAYRLVKGPYPGAEFLARVAALGRDGAMAEWSDPVLVSAC
jgi:hypothetical protein